MNFVPSFLEVLKDLYIFFYPKETKLSINTYIKLIYRVLRYSLPWRAVTEDFTIHHTTLFNFFKRMQKAHIFEIAYKIMKLSCPEDTNYFIDSTMIRNMYGRDTVGKNHYDRFRYASKVTAIVNSKGLPTSLHIVEANINDCLLIEPCLENMQLKIIGSRLKNCNLIGDGGYINARVKKAIKIEDNINMIYPYRIDQKKCNTNDEKILLKKRIVIEHFFAILKQYRRLRDRWDNTIKSFESFLYLACGNIIAKRIF